LITIPGNYGRVGFLAVDGAHVYWTSPGDGQIARANLDGSTPELSFMTGVGQSQLAVDAAHIYYGGRRKLGRANLDGSGRNDTFITGYNVIGLAVDALHGPPGVPARSARIAADGAVRLPRPWVTCPPAAPACTVTVKAKAPLTRRPATASIGQTTFSVAAGKTVSARFTLSGSGRKALKRLRRLKTTITITTRHGAQATTRTVRLTLKAPPR
jgi:hypothetical protein